METPKTSPSCNYFLSLSPCSYNPLSYIHQVLLFTVFFSFFSFFYLKNFYFFPYSCLYFHLWVAFVHIFKWVLAVLHHRVNTKWNVPNGDTGGPEVRQRQEKSISVTENTMIIVGFHGLVSFWCTWICWDDSLMKDLKEGPAASPSCRGDGHRPGIPGHQDLACG